MSTFHIIKYVRGYVYVHLTGYATERFLNLCSNRDILLWDLKPAPDGYYFCISVNGYRQLKPILRKTKTKARILARHGLCFHMFRYRKHKIFAGGVVLCGTLLTLCSGYVWNIEVCGNSYLSEDTVVAFLQTEHAGFGSRKADIDCEALEEALRSAYPEVIWTSVKLYGTKLTVELQENLLPEEDYQTADDTPYDIVAAKDGVIASIITRTGTPLVTEGAEVKKGDLLVSGRLEITNDDGEVTGYLYPGADADVDAFLTYSYTDAINLEYQDKIKTGDKWQNFGFRILNFQFKNPFFHLPDTSFEVTEEDRQLHFTDNFYLPVYFVQYTYEEYQMERITCTDEEAKALANEHFSQYLLNLEQKGIQILEKNVMIEKDNQKYVVRGTVNVKESIVSCQPTEILEITREERQQSNESD